MGPLVRRAPRAGQGSVDWLTEQDFDGFESRDQFFERVFDRWLLPFTMDELAAAYREDVIRYLPPVDAGTFAALAGLRREGWKVAVVTNGSSSQQFAKIKSIGILPLLDGWCISEEVGVRKPDPAILSSQLGGAAPPSTTEDGRRLCRGRYRGRTRRWPIHCMGQAGPRVGKTPSSNPT